MQEIIDYSNRPPSKPKDWIPITIALSIFVIAAITVLFFADPPVPPSGPAQEGNQTQDSSALVIDSPSS